MMSDNIGGKGKRQKSLELGVNHGRDRGDTSPPIFWGGGTSLLTAPPRNLPKYGIFMENVLVNQ